MHLHWDFNYFYFEQTIQFIRAHSNAKIVVGGYLSAVHHESLIRNHDIDYCLFGDYEEPFVALVSAIIGGKSDLWILDHIANVRGKTGISRHSFKCTQEILSRLDSANIDWFPIAPPNTLFDHDGGELAFTNLFGQLPAP